MSRLLKVSSLEKVRDPDTKKSGYVPVFARGKESEDKGLVDKIKRAIVAIYKERQIEEKAKGMLVSMRKLMKIAFLRQENSTHRLVLLVT